LADLLFVDAADLDRVLVGSLDVDSFRNREIDVVAVAQLKPQIAALGGSAIADAADFEDLGEAFANAGDQVLNHGPLHAPEGARLLGVVGRLHEDTVVTDVIGDLFAHLQLEHALGAFDRKDLPFRRGRHARRQRHWAFSDTGH